jgi:iron-sulfur cluster repair protein YtfE (RIC family)
MTSHEQQRAYVSDLQKMWRKVARVHGYDSPQEVAILKVLDDEVKKLIKMEKKDA